MSTLSALPGLLWPHHHQQLQSPPRRFMSQLLLSSQGLVTTLIFSALILLSSCQGSSNLKVTTDKGDIQGSLQGQTIRFLGIPYATAKRFQFPNTNLPAWDTPYSATDYAPACSQACTRAQPDCPKQMEEDCLALNIYRPASSLQGKKLYPVIVYIHGGDFSSGSGSSAVYDASYFSSRGRVVVVTLNYRLGAFGFLSIFDKYGEATGNFGLRDQQAALLWIHTNIAAFEGDPTKVTLMGDGSGCASVVTHLSSISTQALFHATALHSCPFNVPFRSREEARLQSEAFAKVLDCSVNNVSCYREKSVSEILQAQNSVDASAYTSNQLLSFYPWGPSIDNTEVFYNPMDVFADLGRFSNKPVVIGTVADEGLGFVYKKFRLPLPLTDFNSFLTSSAPSYRPMTVTSASTIPSGGAGDMRELLAEIVKDFVFTCPAQYVAKQIEAKQKLDGQNVDKIWVFEFSKPTRLPSLNVNQQSSQQQTMITPLRSLWRPVSLSEKICHTRSCHGTDISTLFNPGSLPYIQRLVNEPLTRRMIQYWSNFARRESVNGAITSRSHLRNLQMRSAMMPVVDPSAAAFLGSTGSSRSRPRSQRFNFRPFGVRDSTQFVPASTSVLLSALKAFTYWPTFSTTDEREVDSVMLLRSPLLMSNASHFDSRCSGFLNSRPLL